MKLAIASWSNRPNIKSITYPIFKKYADYYNLDFIYDWSPINKFGNGFLYWAYQKFGIYDILEDYDAVCWIDDDILITNNAKNIFEFAPITKFSFVNHPGCDTSYINFIQKQFDIDNWWVNAESNKSYSQVAEFKDFVTDNSVNSGLMVVPKKYRFLFETSQLNPPYEGYEDQAYINAIINKKKIDYHILGQEWNLSTGFYHSMEARKLCYFLHVNGRGWDNPAKAIPYDQLPESINNTVTLPSDDWSPDLRSGAVDGPDLYRAYELLYFINHGVIPFSKRQDKLCVNYLN